jgi:putative membrane protein
MPQVQGCSPGRLKRRAVFRRKFMHTKWGMAVIFSALLLTGSVFAQQKQTDKSQSSMLSSADQNFITTAAEANLAEIETAKAVESKSTDPAVKDFANRMVADHTEANQKLATVAETAGIKLPTEPSATERNQLDEMQKLSGAKLNATYLDDELQGHKQVISTFEQEIEHGRDQAVKNYAEQTLPTLQDHIRIAEDLAGKMGMSGKLGLDKETKAIAVK